MATDKHEMNILLVILDSVRASNMSVYGHVNENTPFLQTLIDGSATLYTQARSPSIWSVPSHISMFTGFDVAAHGVVSRHDKLEPGHTIWEKLSKEHGYSTGIFSPNLFLTDLPIGIKKSFQTVEGRHPQHVPFPDAPNPREFSNEVGPNTIWAYLKYCYQSNATGRGLTNALAFKAIRHINSRHLPERYTALGLHAETDVENFLRWECQQTEPWAACINFTDAHSPYNPPKEYNKWADSELFRLQSKLDDQVWEFVKGRRPWWQRKALEALYDGAIAYLDAQIESLLGKLEERGQLDDTLVVITSDHGEGFGEQSRVRTDVRVAGHNYGIHEALLHVPLVVLDPRNQTPKRIQEPATLTRFPAVVRDAISGQRSEFGTFVPPEGKLIASSFERKEDFESEVRVDAVTRVRGDAHAVFEVKNGVVTKYATWGDESAMVSCRNLQSAYKSSDNARQIVSEAIDGVRSVPIRAGSLSADMSEETKRTLQELGYI